DYGLTVAALAMFMQLAEALELSQQVTIEGDCRRDTLEWLRRWRGKNEGIERDAKAAVRAMNKARNFPYRNNAGLSPCRNNCPKAWQKSSAASIGVQPDDEVHRSAEALLSQCGFFGRRAPSCAN
ncbi:MAG: hypothetical protein U5N55_12810, partial [Cypionkella sp.]|nr:hypothetical protein [Cypionkella sp.]